MSLQVWSGKSPITGAPIVGLVSVGSENPKTGDVDTLWILHDKVSPTEAVRTGADRAVCGDCPHRHHTGGGCYVVPFQAPAMAWKSRGKSGKRKPSTVLRLGGYGDPGMIPAPALRKIIGKRLASVGYTHQWRRLRAGRRRLLMASVDSLDQAKEAWSKGWRTFRILQGMDDLQSSEILCPATTHGVTCKQCRLCDGSRGPDDRRKNIAIRPHGFLSKRFDV